MVSASHKDIFQKRTAVLTVVLLLGLVVIAARLFWLQVLRGGDMRGQAEQQHSVFLKLFASRGEIDLTDQATLETIPVATNIKQYLVYAVPQDILNPKAASEVLAGALNLPAADILAKITDESRKYAPLKKQLSDQEQQAVEQLKLPGIYLDSEDSRYYPQNSLLSHVVGFVGYNNQNQKVGLYGLERYFDKDLAGANGQLYEEKDTGGGLDFRQYAPGTAGRGRREFGADREQGHPVPGPKYFG